MSEEKISQETVKKDSEKDNSLLNANTQTVCQDGVKRHMRATQRTWTKNSAVDAKNVSTFGAKTLDTVKIGGSAMITKVNGTGNLRCRLLDMGLIPRTQVSVVKAAPMGDPIEIRIRGYELTLRKEDAHYIEVKDL